MKVKSLDPAGHIKLAVGNFLQSKKFYFSLFKSLVFKQISDKKDRAAWVTKEGLGIWMAQAHNPGYLYKFCSPGLHHLCFKAKNKREVDKISQFLFRKKVKIFEGPQSYPNYTPKYYAVFFADADGIKLEVAYY